MSTREVLVERADVANDDIDDIIEIAAEIQEMERQAAEGASTEEVRAVAEELDIAPEYVDAAIARLKTRREETAAEAKRAEVEAEEAATKTKTLLMGVAGVAVVGGILLAVVLGITAISADSRLDAALAAQQSAESNLVVVLDRQATLAPQLVAMAGGRSAELSTLAGALASAPDLQAKLKASDALAGAMATQLGALPPATDPTSAQSRADMQHEVTGIANRITVERRRFEEARLSYEQAHNGLGASLATGLGLH